MSGKQGDPGPANRATTYWDYIRVDELIDLQGGLEHDESSLSGEEVLFITVHQVFELWFKLVLRDVIAARDLFGAEEVAEQELSGAVARLRRATTIFRVAASHFEVVETLGTREYLEFRDKLMPASGFQSAQLRCIEIYLGLEDSERIPFGGSNSHMRSLETPGGGSTPSLDRALAAKADAPSLREAIESWLARTPIDGVSHDDSAATERLDSFIDRYLEAHDKALAASAERAKSLAGPEDGSRVEAMYAGEREALESFLRPSEEEGGARRGRVRAAMLFIETYRDLPLLAWPREVQAALIEFEQAMLVFRQRHARMVERVIGRRTGTGGTAGVDYLDQTAMTYRVFRDLWSVRTLMLPVSAAPPLQDAAFYEFVAGRS